MQILFCWLDTFFSQEKKVGKRFDAMQYHKLLFGPATKS
jgi:hypothetical protein